MNRFWSSVVHGLSPYVPGEQPKLDGIIKLNTNENPYPPTPRVFEAIRAALTGDRLRKYPDPLGNDFRRTASRILGVDPDAILIGNGSDDILTILTRAFVSDGGLIVSPTPSYILYKTLAEIQGARFEQVDYTSDWRLPEPWPIHGANLTFIANPNSPSGTCVPLAELERLIEQSAGSVVIDEAYVDFADANALPLLARPNVVITRSLSKSYALAGIRFGYAVADPVLVRELIKVKDSYNCDTLSLAAATAALEDQDYLRETRTKIVATRARLTAELTQLGFDVTPSQANFVWCRRNDRPVRPIYEALKKRRILVRYMKYDGYGDGLRISVGSDEEVKRLMESIRGVI
jgi:histidinol-phosphate aminotransferase